MAEQTGIEWADATWNPWMGCKKVSPGCMNCYMFREQTFYGRDPKTIIRAARSSFNNPLKWAKNGKLKVGARIFTCSWSDFFIEQADEWRDDAWKIIRETPQFNYLILTKRPERIEQCIPKDWGLGYRNVWLGISAEDQKTFDARTLILFQTSARIHWVSAEPLLYAIDLHLGYSYIDWIVAGGESDKKNPRLLPLDFFRHLRDQCAEFKIPFYFKQRGGQYKINGHWGGNVLDGKTHNEFPELK